MQMVQDSLVAKAIAEHQRQQAQRLQRSTQPRQRTGKKVYHPTADAQQPVSVSATVPQPLTSTSHSGQSIQYQSEVMQYTSRSHVDPSSGQSQSVEKHQTFSKPLPTAIANNDDVSLNAPLPKRQRTYTQQDGNLKRKSSASKIVLADDLLVEPQVVANAFSQNLSVPPSAEAFAQNLPVLSSAEAFANAFAQNSSVPPSAKALASAFAQNLSAPPSADAFASAFAQNSSVPPSAKALASAFAQNLSVPTPPLNQQNSAVAQNVVPQIPYTHSNWADEIQDVTFLVGWWPMVIVERMENLGFKAVYHLLSATEYIRYAQLCHPDRYAAIASMNQDQLEESMRCFNEQVKIWLFVLMSGPPPPPLLMSEIPTPSSSHKRKRSESCANEPLTHSPHIFDPDFFNLITLPLNVLPPTPFLSNDHALKMNYMDKLKFRSLASNVDTWIRQLLPHRFLPFWSRHCRPHLISNNSLFVITL
ncbi:hypothetical protein BC829DRAFT_178970 [Chytridium lagenaria]|nr:hypothetical protein BC829DRAFT_178970 [Chytridium lagenaria]